MTEPNKKIGLVLPAGGARAAYQVGVLRYMAETFPEFRPTIFTGISAGSINASFLAQGEPFESAAVKLYDLWAHLEFNQVLQTHFTTLFRMVARWVYDLFVSKLTHKLLLKSLLDASPLAHTLLSHIYFWKIGKAIREGTVDGLAISATNYHNGQTTVFFDSHLPMDPWSREQRCAIRTSLRLKHVIASCSIPILFEPIRIGDYLYGDGSLRFNFPFSPAIKLGATRLFAVGIRCPNPQNPLGFKPHHVGMGFVAGAVLNSIFLDSIDADFENVNRMNRVSKASKGAVLPLPCRLVRPSQDLGSLAKEHFSEVPFHLKQLLRSTAPPEELGDLLSYLMFSPGYLRALLQLGMKDAAARKEDLKAFLTE